MIKSWANATTRRFAEQAKSKFSGMDPDKADLRLAALHVATSLAELGRLKSVGLHRLAGDRRGQWAMTINGPWRLCFSFKDGDAYDVEIVDYH